MSDDVRLEEALAAYGRASLRVLSLMDISAKQRERISDLEAEVDKLRYDNHILKETASGEIAAIRMQKAETVVIASEDYEPQEPGIILPFQNATPPRR